MQLESNDLAIDEMQLIDFSQKPRTKKKKTKKEAPETQEAPQ